MEANMDYENELKEHLSDGRINKEALRKYSSIIATLRKNDVIIDRIWKYGQPWPDGIIVRGRLGVDELSKISDVFKFPELQGIEVFPLGIINPELLDVRFKLGEQIIEG